MKIKLVVVNENTLGYIDPDSPDYLGILQASVIKGATCTQSPRAIFPHDEIRLATDTDFEEYRVSAESYMKEEYEYNRG